MLEKIKLADFIYQVNMIESFSMKTNSWGWSCPAKSFYSPKCEDIETQIPKFVKDLKEKKIIREDIKDLICTLCDWETNAEGIFFTSKAIYVNSSKNKLKKFRIRYDDITELKCYKNLNELDIKDYQNITYSINTKLWNAHSIKIFLEFATEQYNYEEKEKELIYNINLPNYENRNVGSIISGNVYGNVSSSATIYGEEKFNASRGHGFAAERANFLYDKISGRHSEIVGDNNAKNGADRVVDGINIQSKYCSSGSKCIAECFENHKFRYINQDGSPMQIEVPSDNYDAAISAMKNRIQNGEVPGVTNPEDAKKIVRKGHFTYEQAKNIAKAGTIESITYDAVNGAIISAYSFGITTAISFATALWNGESLDVALKNSIANGLKVGGAAFVTAILAGQLTKAGMNSLLVCSSESIINFIGPKGAEILANAFRSGTKIYGAAAMKSASKMLRTNIITSSISIVILSTGDVINIFRNRISGPQLFKNFASTASSVAGGTAGWVGGAAAGGAIGTAVPIVGNVIGATIGGIIGAFCGGSIAGSATSSAIGCFIEDDANDMILIIEQNFIELVENYLLTQKEVEHVTDHLGESLNGECLKIMFSCSDKNDFAKKLIIPHIEKEISRRKIVILPNIDAMEYGLKLWIEEQPDGVTN